MVKPAQSTTPASPRCPRRGGETSGRGDAPPEGSARSGEGGYTLVALAIAISILLILVGAALPMWSTLAQREREEELIFRGWQYAEAIRVFQQRHGRLPIRLDELEKVKPRSIRRLWEDPMTESGEWGLVFQGAQAGAQIRGQDLAGGTPPNGPTGPNGRPQGGNRRGGRPGGKGGPDQETVGPIVGVHSRSTDESLKVLFGEEQYDRWTFTVDRLTQARQQVGGQVGGPAGGQVGGQVAPGAAPGQFANLPSPRWIGRPFREGLQPAGGNAPGALPGASGTGPNGRQPGAGGPGSPVPPQRPNQ